MTDILLICYSEQSFRSFFNIFVYVFISKLTTNFNNFKEIDQNINLTGQNVCRKALFQHHIYTYLKHWMVAITNNVEWLPTNLYSRYINSSVCIGSTSRTTFETPAGGLNIRIYSILYNSFSELLQL